MNSRIVIALPKRYANVINLFQNYLITFCNFIKKFILAMITYNYSAFSKILYRYANVAITFFLLFYVVASLILTMQKWYYVFVFLVNVLIIFYINRFYFRSYKLFPFKIKADNSKLICSNYFFSKKVIEVELQNIDKISGGIFSGWPTRPIYIHDAKNDVTIGIYMHAANFRRLLKTILENIPQSVYNDLLDKIKSLEGQK